MFELKFKLEPFFNPTKTTSNDLKFDRGVKGKVYGLQEKNEHLWTTENGACKNERNKKEEGGDDTWADLREMGRG